MTRHILISTDRFLGVDVNGEQIPCQNPDYYDGDGWQLYVVYLAAIGHPICVTAADEWDAIDEAADYAWAQGWVGYFLDPETLDDPDDDVLCVGNEGRPVRNSEISVFRAVRS